MKQKYLRKLIMIMLSITLILVISCKKDKVIDPNDDDPPLDTEASDIDKFIWYNMNLYYLWYQNVPNLADNRFSTTNDLYTFLNTYSDHEDLFYDILHQYGTIDKWSWIVDDYVALENLFQGITTSTGMEYGLVKFSDSDNIFGYVQYVVPGSPADIAGIKRGDIFISIDSQTLNINNYRDLLYGRDAFEISFADNNFVLNNITLSLTAVEVHENPIHHTKIIESEGKKIGYLLYNGFRSNYDLELNEVFGEFESAGIQELILDLRYNGGGSVQTATYLASMIYGTNATDIFSINQYNDKLEDHFEENYGPEYFNNRFKDAIAGADGVPDVLINSLNLSKVYIIATGGSASASELLINGLRPYMDVILIGESTHGKYVGSFTLKDYDNDGVLNTSHTWALQPITLKIANSEGVSDFVNGFAPTVAADEGYINLLPFGNQNEILLKAALDHINGIVTTKSWEPKSYRIVADSRDLAAHKKEMYLEGDFIIPKK